MLRFKKHTDMGLLLYNLMFRMTREVLKLVNYKHHQLCSLIFPSWLDNTCASLSLLPKAAQWGSVQESKVTKHHSVTFTFYFSSQRLQSVSFSVIQYQTTSFQRFTCIYVAKYIYKYIMFCIIKLRVIPIHKPLISIE